MGFFEKPVLTKKRRGQLDKFRENAVKAIEEMIKEEKNETIRNALDTALSNVENTPLKFYPRRSLRSAIYSTRGRVFGSMLKGLSVNRIAVMQKGPKMFVIRSRHIELPAEHLFEGDRLTLDGVHTLMHEYCHSVRNVSEFAEKLKLSPEQAEELIADLLSARIAVKMGIERETVYGFYGGRGMVYGGFPFHEMLKRALKL